MSDLSQLTKDIKELTKIAGENDKQFAAHMAHHTAQNGAIQQSLKENRGDHEKIFNRLGELAIADGQKPSWIVTAGISGLTFLLGISITVIGYLVKLL